MTFALFIRVVKRLKSPGVVILTFSTPEKKTISSHHDQTNEVSHKKFNGRIITSKSYNMNSMQVVMVFLPLTFFVYC